MEPLSQDSPLKPRELEVLRHMADGLTNREIAARLYIGVETVRTYAKQIYAKLEVSDRSSAARKAQALGLLAQSLDDQNAIFSDKHRLPPQLTPFVGRRRELDELQHLVERAEVRLVTILASGGMGKTRTAIELATRQIGKYQDGIYFVALQPLSDADNIVPAIAEVLSLKFQQGNRDPKQQLLDYLSQKQILLVMDNWEHLLAGSTLVAEILKAAPGVRIVATSREKLNLSAEHVFVLGGMQFPEWETPADALEYDALQLLVQSAQRVKPDWQVTDTLLDDVAQICRLTAGMPLGILLAASWLDVLPLHEIATEIQNNVSFLETSMRDVPERQRSIRAVFDHTWQRLEVDERETFAKLSVFRGGFTRQAAQTAAGATLRSLQRLVEKALLTRNDDERYDVHELLRHFGEEQLDSSEASEQVRQAHSQYFLQWLTALDGDIKGRRQHEALNDIEHDFENMRVAWQWSARRGYFTWLDDAGESLMWYSEMRARFVEGQALFAQALAQLPDSLEHEVIWSRLTIRYYRLIEQPDIDANLERALAIAERHANRADVAMCYVIYGSSYWAHQVDNHKALDFFEQAYAEYRALGDTFYTASALNRVGLGHDSLGQVEEAIHFTRESAEMQRTIGDLSGLGISLNNLAAFYCLTERVEEGLVLLTENIELGARSGNDANLSFSYGLSSNVHFYVGDFDLAHEHARLAIRLAQQIGYLQSESMGGSALALLACIEDEDYQSGLGASQRAFELAAMSNVTVGSYAHIASALACCGLGRFAAARDYLQKLDRMDFFSQSILRLGPIAALGSVFYYEMGDYQQALRYLSVVLTGTHAYFGWAKVWPLLARIRADLESQLDAASFDTLWEEGRQMPLKVAAEQILRDIN